MKKLLIAVLLFPPIMGYAQELERNEVDKYTKSSIKETTWFKLQTKFTEVLSCRARQVDGVYYLELSISMPTAFRSDLDDIVYLLMDNSKTIEIQCVRGGISDYRYNKYSSHWNARFLYQVTLSQIEELKKHKIVGLRIGLGSEYTTFDKVKEKNADKLQIALALITNGTNIDLDSELND